MTERGKLSAAFRPPWDTGWMQPARSSSRRWRAPSRRVPAAPRPPASKTRRRQRRLRSAPAAPAPAGIPPRPGRSTARTRRGPASPPTCRPRARSASGGPPTWTAPCTASRSSSATRSSRRRRTTPCTRSANQRARWSGGTHLGTPVPRSSLQCGDIDPLGITGTPVYDEGNGLVYAVAETTGYHHVLFGLAVSDGAIRVQREIDSPPRATTAALPAAAGAGHRRRPGLRGVRRAVRRLRAVHRHGRRGTAVRDGRARQLAHARQQGRRRVGHRRAGHRPGRRPVGLDRERRGRATGRAVRRQRLGEQAQPEPRQR